MYEIHFIVSFQQLSAIIMGKKLGMFCGSWLIVYEDDKTKMHNNMLFAWLKMSEK